MCLLSWTDAECSSTVGRCPMLRHGGCTVPCTASSSTPLVTGLCSRCRGCPYRVWHTSNLCLPCQERPRNGWPFMCSNKWFATVFSGFVAPLNASEVHWWSPPSHLLPRTGLKTFQAISPSSSYLSHSTRLIHGKQTPTHHCVLIPSTALKSWVEMNSIFGISIEL